MRLFILLSKLERELIRGKRRGSIERIFQPLPEVAIAEQMHADECDQVRQRPIPPAAELQKLQDENGDERRPDLGTDSVGGGTDEGLDVQVLLDGFEKRFDLPSIAVDLGDGGSGQTEVVREELHGEVPSSSWITTRRKRSGSKA